MRKDVVSKPVPVTVRELLLEHAMLSRGVARDLSIQHAASLVLGDRPIDPAMTRDILKNAIKHFDRNADEMEALAERSKGALSQMTPLRFITQMTLSLLLAMALAASLLTGLFYVLDRIDPPEKVKPGTVWMTMPPESRQ